MCVMGVALQYPNADTFFYKEFQMLNFCPHCGTAISKNNSKNCISCEKILHVSSETIKNDSKEKFLNFAKNVKDLTIKVSEDLKTDETRAKIRDFANQAQSFASEKTKDLKEELEKINEARIHATQQSNFKEAQNKKKAILNASLNFWLMLSSKQKGLVVGLPLLLLIFYMAIFVNKSYSNSEAISSLEIYQYENCKLETVLIDWKIRSDLGGFSSIADSNNFVKPATDRLVNFQKDFPSRELTYWAKDDSKKQAYVRCMMDSENFPCDTRRRVLNDLKDVYGNKCSKP